MTNERIRFIAELSHGLASIWYAFYEIWKKPKYKAMVVIKTDRKLLEWHSKQMKG